MQMNHASRGRILKRDESQRLSEGLICIWNTLSIFFRRFSCEKEVTDEGEIRDGRFWIWKNLDEFGEFGGRTLFPAKFEFIIIIVACYNSYMCNVSKVPQGNGE